MNISKIESAPDCFDGDFMKDVYFDSNITKEFIYKLGLLGNLQYYSDFPRPFFRIDFPDGTIVKGIEGNNKASLILSRNHIANSLNCFKEAVMELACF